MSQLKSDWLKGKNPEEVKAIKEALAHNVALREAVLSLVDRVEAEERRHEISLEEYNNPSWAYKQADRNGALRMLNKFRSLFTM